MNSSLVSVAGIVPLAVFGPGSSIAWTSPSNLARSSVPRLVTALSNRAGRFIVSMKSVLRNSSESLRSWSGKLLATPQRWLATLMTSSSSTSIPSFRTASGRSLSHLSFELPNEETTAQLSSLSNDEVAPPSVSKKRAPELELSERIAELLGYRPPVQSQAKSNPVSTSAELIKADALEPAPQLTLPKELVDALSEIRNKQRERSEHIDLQAKIKRLEIASKKNEDFSKTQSASSALKANQDPRIEENLIKIQALDKEINKICQTFLDNFQSWVKNTITEETDKESITTSWVFSMDECIKNTLKEIIKNTNESKKLIRKEEKILKVPSKFDSLLLDFTKQLALIAAEKAKQITTQLEELLRKYNEKFETEFLPDEKNSLIFLAIISSISYRLSKKIGQLNKTYIHSIHSTAALDDRLRDIYGKLTAQFFTTRLEELRSSLSERDYAKLNKNLDKHMNGNHESHLTNQNPIIHTDIDSEIFGETEEMLKEISLPDDQIHQILNYLKNKVKNENSTRMLATLFVLKEIANLAHKMKEILPDVFKSSSGWGNCLVMKSTIQKILGIIS